MCRDLDGNKYKVVMKWNIFVVIREWLFVCVVSGILVFIDKYLVDKDKIIEMDNIDNFFLENLRFDEFFIKGDVEEVNMKIV